MMIKINAIHICFILSCVVHVLVVGSGILTFDKSPVADEPEIVFEIEKQEYLPDVYQITEEKKIEKTLEEPEPEKPEKIENVVEEVKDLNHEEPEKPEEVIIKDEELDQKEPDTLEKVIEEVTVPEKIEKVHTQEQDHAKDEVKKSLLLYQDSIKQKIQKNKRYPRWALRAKHQGIARVAFEVLSSGDVRNLNLLQSSGFKELDDEAMKAIKRATPFALFPEILKEDKIKIEIDIVFKISLQR